MPVLPVNDDNVLFVIRLEVEFSTPIRAKTFKAQVLVNDENSPQLHFLFRYKIFLIARPDQAWSSLSYQGEK